MISLPDNRTRRALAATFRQLHRYSSAWAVVLPGTLCLAMMRLPMPLLSGYIIDRLVNDHSYLDLNMVCGTLLVLIALFISLQYVVDYLTFRVTSSLAIRYKVQLFGHIQLLPADFTLKKETGYVMSRITTDPAVVGDLITQAMILGTSILTLIVGISTVFIIDARMACMSMAVLPFFAAPFVVLQNRVRSLSNQKKELAALVSKNLQESVRAIPLTKLCLLYSRESRRFLRSLRNELSVSIKAFNCDYSIGGISGFFASLGPLVVIWYGGREVLAGHLSIGHLVAFSAVLAFLFGPTKMIVTSNVGLLQSLVSLNRVYELLGERTEGSLSATGTPVVMRHHGLSFRNVTFNYGAAKETLVGVNLDIPDGEVIGIVGPTGAGKTTLVSLLTGYRRPTAGHIFIGERDLQDVPLRQLRSIVSLLPQEPFLFSTTVYENILMGNPRVSSVEVVRAAERANALGFIRTLSDGFDTHVGEAGRALSGGQRQLICLARTILRDSPVVVLDEPTSEIDSRTEQLMQDSLAWFVKGRTTIIVSHRLSTLLHVARIAVLEGGAISAVGRHADLLRRSSFYSTLANAQSCI